MQFIACLAILMLATTAASGQVSYAYGAKILGAKVHYVIVNPFSDKIRITPAYVAGGLPFEAFIVLYRPLVAINGTFFNPKTKHPVGDIVIERTHLNKGKLRTALIVEGPFALITTIPTTTNFTGKVESLLACGPRLLTGGRITVYPAAEGFRDKRLFRPARRSAVGVTKHGKVVFAVIVTPVTLTKAAKIMQALGCVDAMNLDGGGSSALYCAGKFFVKPNRKLSTVLMVLPTQDLKMVGLEGGQ
ncbi:MAG: phosphodiester glycosidase family protein [Armatimonadota bacterium]